MAVGSQLQLTVASTILYYSTLALSSCPQFGSDLIPETFSTFDGLFLNINSPSQCHGNITQWEFCYSRSGSSSRTHEVQFMVYRRNENTFTYNRTPGSFTTFRRSGLPQTDCTFLSLDRNEWFEIQPNDILAVCMRDQGDTYPLRVTKTQPEQNIRIRTNSVSDDCREDQLLSLNFGSLNTDIENVILVKAIINTTIGYRIGHNPASSYTSMSTFGIFINTEFPAQSNGLVTSYNYCYYTDSVSLTSTYSAIFSVWRNDSQSSNLTMVAGSSVTVTLQPQYTIAAIHCQLVELEPENHFIVMEGDYVGVALPMNNPIPIIGSSNDHTSLSHPYDPESTSLAINSFMSVTSILHLYADIDSSVQITTQISSTATNTISDDTTSFFNENERTLSGGAVAAIIVVVLIILLIIGIAGAILILLVIRWKNKTSEPEDAIQHITVKGIDNINYISYKGEDYPNSSSTNRDTSADNDYLQPMRRTHKQSILEASFYSSINMDNDNIYASIMDESISNRYYELEPIYYEEPSEEEEHLYGQIYSDTNRAKNIDGERIKFVRHLGSGQFGNVNEGIWFDDDKEIKVALKTLREDATSEDKVKFLQEAVIMAQFNHDNVIKLLAMVLEDNPMVLVVELASRGDLRQNLLEIRAECTDPSLPKLLLYFSRQVVHGMHYLSSKRFVHRDLAARNILLSENCLCKIADFGMSRDLADDTYYSSSGGLVPVKWTAPEAIKFKKYSTASDVWSYGCVLYEIWSLGHKPFEDLKNLEVISTLDQGIRLPPPTGCPRAIYTAMINCWHSEARSRPTFRDLVIMLTKDVLKVPPSVVTTVPEFKTLGGSLEVGRHVYQDLQNTYK